MQIHDDKKNEEGLYNLGCFYCDKCTRNKDAYKKNEEKWWFVSTVDFNKLIPDPSEERDSGKWKLFYFKL